MRTAFGGDETDGEWWTYVGRFMWGFAFVESTINTIFLDLFDIKGIFAYLLLGNLDLRRKLDMLDVAFKHQGVKAENLIKRIHKLHDIRNVIAHHHFDYDDNGLTFDTYLNKKGQPVLPHRPKGEPEHPDDNLVITYSEFDAYDRDAAELHDELLNLWVTLTPITDIGDDLKAEIEDVLASPSKIIPFPRNRTRSHQDTTTEEKDLT
jgi:hypothetical protein